MKFILPFIAFFTLTPTWSPAAGSDTPEGVMENKASETTIGRMAPQTLRQELQQGTSPDVKRRRRITLIALFAMINMAIVSLFQMGVIKGLWDPPLSFFDSAKVNSSDRAYKYGVPDGIVDLAMLSLLIMVTAMGGEKRAETLWVVPVGVAMFALAQAGGAVFYFFEMIKMKVACVYCVLTALTHVAIFPLTVPEAWRAAAGFVNRV